jgi:hypothetical protein
MDVVIPIVFPDYLISVTTPTVEIKVPDLLPFIDVFPNHVRIPSSKHQVAELGHTGVLFIDGRSGTTKYYEYGRYDKAQLGLTRRIPIPDVKISTEKKPTHDSLEVVLMRISQNAGQNGRIEGAYIELPPGKYAAMLQYAMMRVQQNHNPNRQKYSLTSNSCMHFTKQVAEAGGAKLPWIVDPRPNSFIAEVQSIYPKLTFLPPSSLTIAS